MNGSMKAPTGIVLSGGGARGSYQAGSIRALCEIATRHGISRPYPIITGTSAGSINAAFLAAHIDHLEVAGNTIAKLWAQLKTDMVICTDTITLGRIGLRLIRELTTGSFIKRKKVLALLDTSPLANLLRLNIPFGNIKRNIEEGFLRAVAVTATNYANSNRVTFVQGNNDVAGWKKVRRYSERCDLDVNHVMASAAIPVFFPPVQVDNGFYGDGCLRNLSPLSPAIKLGAEKLIIIGVQKEITLTDPNEGKTVIMPTLARIISVITNALLMDNVFLDIERLSRVNETVRLVQKTTSEPVKLKPIEFLYIRPSEDIGKIAFEESESLPPTLKFLIDGLGSRREAAELISYLLFEGSYCQRLLELGYRDTMAHEQEILKIIF